MLVDHFTIDGLPAFVKLVPLRDDFQQICRSMGRDIGPREEAENTSSPGRRSHGPLITSKGPGRQPAAHNRKAQQ